MTDELPKLLDGDSGEAARKMLGDREKPRVTTTHDYRSRVDYDDTLRDDYYRGDHRRSDMNRPPNSEPMPRFETHAGSAFANGFRYFSIAVPEQVKLTSQMLYVGKTGVREISLTLPNRVEALNDMLGAVNSLSGQILDALLAEEAKIKKAEDTKLTPQHEYTDGRPLGEEPSFKAPLMRQEGPDAQLYSSGRPRICAFHTNELIAERLDASVKRHKDGDATVGPMIDDLREEQRLRSRELRNRESKRKD